jgi:hypothetical protein
MGADGEHATVAAFLLQRMKFDAYGVRLKNMFGAIGMRMPIEPNWRDQT